MRFELVDLWEHQCTIRRIDAVPAFTDDGLVLGAGTLLVPIVRSTQKRLTLGSDAQHDRLVALLAVAGRGRLAADAVAHIDVALDDWARVDKGLAAIRLAFAPLPRLADASDAYTLFLAEKALDAGLSPRDLLAELGFDAVAPLLKGAVDQPRVPAGAGRTSGRWTNGSDAGASGETAPRRTATGASRAEAPTDGQATIVPVFLDTRRDSENVVGDKPSPFQPRQSPQNIGEGHALDAAIPKGAPVPLPFEVPSPSPDADEDKDGPACPAMRPDQPHGASAAAQIREALIALLSTRAIQRRSRHPTIRRFNHKPISCPCPARRTTGSPTTIASGRTNPLRYQI